MSLYEKKPVVVIDDSIYDLMVSYKDIFCKKEFGTPPGRVKFIKRSELTSIISAERIDDFGVYFYIFEEINTADEYIDACKDFVDSTNIEIVMLFCQKSTSFDLCCCQESKASCRVHNIGIKYDFSLDKRKLFSEEEMKVKNCINLMVMLLYLLSFEEGSFDDFSVKLKLNYPSVNAAVKYSLLEYKEKLDDVLKRIKGEKRTIENLEREKSYRYKIRFSVDSAEESVPPLPNLEKEAEKSLSQITAFYTDREGAFKDRIKEDIFATRYAMAEMDEYAQGGAMPELVINRAEQTERKITGDDLLKKVESGTEVRMNVKQAIALARDLVKTQRPVFRPFLIAGGMSCVICILITASYYVINLVKNPGITFDMRFLAVNIIAPVLLIISAIVVGFIANIFAFGKIKSVLKEIHEVVVEHTASMNKFTERVRAYLNDFITVFCNYHIKDFYILQCRKRERLLEQERESIMKSAEPLSEIVELITTLYSCEKELEESAYDESLTDEFYRSEDICVGYDEDAVQDMSEQIVDESKEEDGGGYNDIRECVAFIKKRCSTQIDGTENDVFVNSQSPWISALTVSDCVNGGVL